MGMPEGQPQNCSMDTMGQQFANVILALRVGMLIVFTVGPLMVGYENLAMSVCLAMPAFQ